MLASKLPKFSSTLTLALTFVLIFALALTWVFSLRGVRLKIGDYYYSRGKFDQAANWYVRVVRRQKLRRYGEGSLFQVRNTEEDKPFEKFRNACINSANSHFEQSKTYSSTNLSWAESELKKAFHVCQLFSRNVQDQRVENEYNLKLLKFKDEVSASVNRACVSLTDIYKSRNPKKIFELYWILLDFEESSTNISFADERMKILSLSTGINLLDNPYFADSNGDGIPDGYTFECIGPEATNPNKEIIKTGEFNTYHVWQEQGKGWFATYFQIGRVPPNTFFTYSIEIKRIRTKGEARPMFFTTRVSNKEWGSGSIYSETGLVQDLGDGWKREFHTIRTNNYPDIMLSGWLAAWHYGQAEGDIYVRKPKVEIGNRPTFWNNS